MAKIVANDNAPSEEVTYAFPTGEFTFGSGGSYETADRALLTEAEVHPWLSVEYDKSEVAKPNFRPDTVPADQDYLGSAKSEAFNPEAVERDSVAVLGDGSTVTGTAIDAGLDQGEEVRAGNVAVTLAAASADDDASTPSKKRKS